MSSSRIDLDALKDMVPASWVLEDAGYVIHRGFTLCPNHAEKTPSLKVYERHVHCFGCGFHADVLALSQAIHRSDFSTAVGRIMALAGLTQAPVQDRRAAEARQTERRQRKAAERRRNRRLLACADAYRELTQMAGRVGRNLSAQPDDPDVWTCLDMIYSTRDWVENIEAALQ